MRSLISERSNSANAPIKWNCRRPVAVLVSMASHNDLKAMPCFSRSETREMRCERLRPKRSRRQVTSVSPGLKHARASSNAGQLLKTPENPLSRKICSHPTRSSASICRSTLWEKKRRIQEQKGLAGEPVFVLKPTGNLVFKIERCFANKGQRECLEESGRRLETMVPEIISSIREAAPASLRQWQVQQEEGRKSAEVRERIEIEASDGRLIGTGARPSSNTGIV